MRRRELLAGTAAAAGLAAALAGAQPTAAWNAGPVAHVLPTVSHERMLVKLSLREPAAGPLFLHLDNRRVPGRRTDTGGEFWSFDAAGLDAARTYTLSLTDAGGRPLCDSWPLATFPAPGERPRSLRVLFFTCAGGHDITGRYLPMTTRTRLLDRALSFGPQAAVAIGDHVYWDLRTASRIGSLEPAISHAGRFARELPILGDPNEAVLKRAAGPQIAPLYGARCRSVPVFFLQDDHDYFENDDANERIVSFPPDPFMLAAARATQRLWYPEFLPDPTRPAGLGSTRAEGLSESFGTLRYGALLEALLYDCRRYMTLSGPHATFLPGETEDWLARRMAAEEGAAAHLLNIPSTPPGWSAGKWGEWYPDVERDARLTTAIQKPFWQPGWRAQHDRLLAAASAMRDRTPVFVSGDLHAVGETRISGNGGQDLSRHPVVSVLCGPVGTAARGWPSAFRGMVPQTPSGLAVDERLPAIEENGFTLADFTPEDVTLRFFKWRREAVEAIDTLEPFRTTRLPRA